MTMEERATKTDAIIGALESGKMVEYRLKEKTNPTHNDLSFVEEQEFVLVERSGLANSNIMYSLRQRGRDVYNAGGLLNYLELSRQREQKLLDKSELEGQIAVLQKDKLLYDQTIRDKDAEIKRLQTINLTNQNELHPITKWTAILRLLKILFGIASIFLASIIAEYNYDIVQKLISLL